jgi:hypothetical protein
MGSTVQGYRIKFKAADGTYKTTSSCISTAPATVSCTMLMSVLTQSPFSLAVGANIIASVEAYNAITGYSTPSPDNSVHATAITPPTVSPSLSKNSATSESSITLSWTTITSSPGNGGSAVTGYTVYLGSQIVGNIVCAVSDPTVTSCTPSNTIVAGTSYSYLITASNAYGEGVISTSLSVQASAVPDAITTAPTVTLTGATVSVAWAASPNARSSPVTAYSIVFKIHGSSTY